MRHARHEGTKIPRPIAVERGIGTKSSGLRPSTRSVCAGFVLRTALAALACVGGSVFMTDGAQDAMAASSGNGAAVQPVVKNFSPQGEVAEVRQARATFSAPMVAFGDAQLPAPFDVQCPAAGTGRWINDRTWVYDFTADVGPGTRCSFALKPATRARDGGSIGGKSSFTFSTGGPAIVRNFPSARASTGNDGDDEGGAGIDEEQVFVLVLNGPATPSSVVANAWCEVSGIGERVGARIVDGDDRKQLLKRFALETRADNVTMLACARRLPDDARVELVWGRGIAASSGITAALSSMKSPR